MAGYAIKNILVPTDFSDLSLCALDHARRIAESTGARITLQHVISPRGGGFGTSGMLGIAAKLEDKQQKESMKRLREIASAVQKGTTSRIAVTTGIGNIASTISRTAVESSANLIIMGTHGASGFVENLLGSTTYRVAGHSRVPVMSVNKKPGSKEYSHLVYPVRDKAQAMLKYPYAITFAKMFSARAHIIGLLRPNDKSHEGHMRALCDSIRDRFKHDGIRAKTSFTRTTQFPLATLQYAHKFSNSLVVITQDYDFLLTELFRGTFSKAILHRILSPVLTIPD